MQSAHIEDIKEKDEVMKWLATLEFAHEVWNQEQHLQDELGKYKEKWTKVEESNLLHLDHYERRSCSQDMDEGCSNSEDTNLLEVGDSLEIDIEVRDSLEIDIKAKHLQLSFAKVHRIPCTCREQGDRWSCQHRTKSI